MSKKYSKEQIIYLSKFIDPSGNIPNYDECEKIVRPDFLNKFGINKSGGCLYMLIWRIRRGDHAEKIA